MGLLSKFLLLKAISTDAYPTPAKRPIYSIMKDEKLSFIWYLSHRIGLLAWISILKNIMRDSGLYLVIPTYNGEI